MATVNPRFLFEHLDAEGAFTGVVGVDDGADPILELRDHLAGAVVGGGIGGEEEHHVDVELDRIATDLDVAFLEDVEHPHLDQFVELRQLVHGEDAAVHPGDEAEVEGLLGGHARSSGELRRIDLTDDVGELRAGGKPLGVAFRAVPPADRHVVLRAAGNQRPPGRRDGFEGIVVEGNGGIIEVGDPLVKKPAEQPHHAALRLPLFTQKEHVMTGDEGDVDLGDDGVVIADDAGEEFPAVGEGPEKVLPHFLLHRPTPPTGGAQIGEGPRQRAGIDRGRGGGGGGGWSGGVGHRRVSW